MCCNLVPARGVAGPLSETENSCERNSRSITCLKHRKPRGDWSSQILGCIRAAATEPAGVGAVGRHQQPQRAPALLYLPAFNEKRRQGPSSEKEAGTPGTPEGPTPHLPIRALSAAMRGRPETGSARAGVRLRDFCNTSRFEKKKIFFFKGFWFSGLALSPLPLLWWRWK